MNVTYKSYIPALIALLMGILALGFPLLRDFHLESAILVSVAGCYLAGWKASSRGLTAIQDIRSAMRILGYLYLFGLPLLAGTLLNGCFSVHGLGLWLLYPIPSVFFGYSVGRLCRIWNVPYARLITVAIVTVVAVGVFLAEFLHHPQVYFFNHVWGGWPGPIYDETVQLTDSLFFFRMLTTCWILLLWFLPSVTTDSLSRWVFWLSAAALVLGYTQLAEMGVITPESHLRQKLGGVRETEHFSIYYAKDSYTAREIGLIAREHEFYLDQIADKLELEKPDSTHKIHSYLYAHPWQKKQLVGAKFTSYVPVWLKQDQLHIAKQQIESSLRHELVHVLSKQFGNRLFNASWSIGLVEGIAVALAPDESISSTIDQIVASEKPYPSTGEMRTSLLPYGFYGGRSAVNYTTSGSFVKHLLREYPAEYFKEAYRTGNIEAAYGTSLADLVESWHRHLDAVPVDSLDRQIASRLFSIPSLFEQKCPRILTDFAQAWDQYHFRMAERDTSRALINLDKALHYAPDSESVKARWALLHLKAGNIDKVRQQASMEHPSAELLMLYADAYALAGDRRMAGQYLKQAARRLGPDPVKALQAALSTRTDAEQWRYYLQLTYGQRLFPPDTFAKLHYRTKIRAVEQAIRSEEKDLLIEYAELLLDEPPDMTYFNQYMAMIHWLGYYDHAEVAKNWITKLRSVPLRERHKERLNQEEQWIHYLER